jgi:hypothetical protein
MKAIEITEASKAEKDRQRKAQAIRNRERAQFQLQQQELRLKQAMELRRQAKLKQLQAIIAPKPEQETGIFSSPEFRAFRTDNDIEKGIYLKFEPVGKDLFVYWTTKLNRNLEVIRKITGLFKPLGEFKGTSNENAALIRLINELLDTQEYIHILLDKQIIALFPGLQNFAKYISYLKKNTPFGKRIDMNNEIEETVTLEIF